MIRRVFYNFFLLYKILLYKISEYVDFTYYQKNREVILNIAKDYYENDKERLKRQARDKDRNLSEEEKERIRKEQISQYV